MASISIQQVRAVIAVCEEASFTRAAKREFATQSGISQRIAALETSLGVKLFERSAEGVRPTPAGLCYYNRCPEAVGAIQAAAADVRALQERTPGASDNLLNNGKSATGKGRHERPTRRRETESVVPRRGSDH